jgi:hypothetical protein
MIQKALELHTVGLKSYFFSQNYQMIQKALELHTVGLKSYFFSQNYQMIQKALELHTVGLKSFLGAKNVEKFRPNLVHFCYRFRLKPSTLAPRPLSACRYISRVQLHFDAPHTCSVAPASVFLAIADAAFNTEFPMTAS